MVSGTHETEDKTELLVVTRRRGRLEEKDFPRQRQKVIATIAKASIVLTERWALF